MSVEIALGSVPFFDHLTPGELAQLTDVSRRETHGAGSVVVKEGDAGDRMYVILEGRVRVYKRGDGDHELELGQLGQGEWFGETALFDGAPRSATVCTVEPSEFLTLGHQEFVALLSQSRQLLSHVLAGLATRLRGASDRSFLEMLERQRLQASLEIERHRSIAQMVVGVAHEVNTPLGIINNAASLIAERLSPAVVDSLDKDDETRAAIEDVKDAARLMQTSIARVNTLIQRFKHVSASQITDTREQVDLPALLAEIVDLVAISARRANIQIALENWLDAEAGQWDGYPGSLSQVIMNLVSNVERYAYPDGSGGPVEIVLAAADTTGEPCFVIVVRDHGHGMSAEQVARVFEPFFTTGRDRGGTGLGMAIVHNIVTSLLHGKIDVRSALGKGTTVTIIFPRTVPDRTRDQGGSSSSHEASQASSAHGAG